MALAYTSLIFQNREHEINERIFKRLETIKNLHILAKEHKDRLGIYSFYIDDVHYNLVVRLLNDRFGIQTRGGCSCAGTYGHFLLNLDRSTSKAIEQKILEGCLIDRPGWIRMSFHPTMTNEEVDFICEAIKQIAENIEEWSQSYTYNVQTNEFDCDQGDDAVINNVKKWFSI